MKILIADDYPLILKGLEEFLVESGYKDVLTATTGTQAFELINEEQPDIAILDM